MSARHTWTADEIEILRAEYANTPTRDIAERLGLTSSRVYAKASDLGLTKSAEYYRTHVAGRLDGVKGARTRFRPGLTPWNKGKPHPAAYKAAATMFRPGNRPHTWQPIGSYRVVGDGTLQRKVSDVPGPTHLRWRSVHELVWIAAHGPVPTGNVVVFKPGQRTAVLDDITVDRIELVSRADLVRRNSVHRHGPEIAQLSQLKGAINRQINKRTKEAA